MNREKLLPVQKDQNYYSEWTVKTPWKSDRGARRIIEGHWGELYFTDDHYTSFTRIR
jgi:ribonuclease T1